YYNPGSYYSGTGGYSNYSSGYYGPNTYTTPSNLVTPASYAPNVPNAANQPANLPAGLQISDIADGSPAKKAGLRAGDIITSIGGLRIESSEDLQRALANVNGDVEVAY